MGKKYLNKNARFKCGNGNAVWFKPQNWNFKVKINGAEVLLGDCRLTLIGGPRLGQCNLVPDPSTGAPGMCTAALLSGTWNNNVNTSVNGKDILTSACSISCPVGGKISPFKPTILAINVDDAASKKAVSIASHGEQSSIGTSQGSETQEQSKINEDNDDTDAKMEQESESAANDSKEDDDSTQDVEYALCDYKNCDKANDCEYLKTAHTLSETNESKNATILKTNMGKDAFDLYAGDCAVIATSLYGSYMYSIAHHHIIPANQCFKTFEEIVKLANYYHYDINKAENGITLPTMNAGYDKHPFEERKKIAFYAMKALGRQWHKGGHKYSCKISAELDSILPRPFKHYKDAVDEELIGLRIKLSDDMRCRAENYEQQAAEFIKFMDRICERIAKKLRKFEDAPQKAYPCYISKLAFYYAFIEELEDYEDELFRKDV